MTVFSIRIFLKNFYHERQSYIESAERAVDPAVDPVLVPMKPTRITAKYKKCYGPALRKTIMSG